MTQSTADPSSVQILTRADDDGDESEQSQEGQESDEGRFESLV